MNQDLPSFDTLVLIARHDPDQLEKIRKHLSARTINSAPGYLRPRLRGLQFRIDATRRLAKTPMAACIQLSTMMLQSFEQLRAALNDPAPADAHIVSSRPKARIIPFRRPQMSSSRQIS